MQTGQSSLGNNGCRGWQRVLPPREVALPDALLAVAGDAHDTASHGWLTPHNPPGGAHLRRLWKQLLAPRHGRGTRDAGVEPHPQRYLS
jgi:hypothetical protein